MKSIKITYQCDYCREIIDADSDTVRAVLPGRIGYQDSFLPDSEEEIRHFHDYCLEHLLTMRFEEPKEEVKEEPVPEPEPKRNIKKDLGKLQSLLNAKWTRVEIADEFGVSEATIYNWIKELKGRNN